MPAPFRTLPTCDIRVRLLHTALSYRKAFGRQRALELSFRASGRYLMFVACFYRHHGRHAGYTIILAHA